MEVAVTCADSAKKNSDTPNVDVRRCTGCGRCVAACGERLFSLETTGYRKHAVLRKPTCCGCQKCLEACPVAALSVAPGEERSEPSPLSGEESRCRQDSSS